MAQFGGDRQFGSSSGGGSRWDPPNSGRRLANLSWGGGCALDPCTQGGIACHPPRLLASKHDRQLQDPISGNETQIFKRSVFGFVAIYNRLPQRVVEVKSVKGFQKMLQGAMRQNMRRGIEEWSSMYSFIRELRTLHGFSVVLLNFVYKE